jgi:predicted outer membrane protein
VQRGKTENTRNTKNIQLPSWAAMSKHLTDLQKKAGKDFDKAYLNMMKMIMKMTSRIQKSHRQSKTGPARICREFVARVAKHLIQ